MKAKPVRRRRLARRDVEQAVIYYAREAGLDVAARFIAEVDDSCRAIGEQPGLGSPRYAHLLQIAGLRSRPVGRFPYRVLYVEHEDHIEVQRVLHTQRDIPAWLGETDS